MKLLTKLSQPIFAPTYKSMMAHARDAEISQRKLLRWLIDSARNTEFGKVHSYDKIGNYSDYVSAVPIADYTAFRDYVNRMIYGEANVLWRGLCRNFAQSSGTSDGKSKYIPITTDSFNMTHYQGGKDVVATYLHLNRDSHIFDGQTFILGGSFANSLNNLPEGVRVGDLSANLIQNINPCINLFRVPSKQIALNPDWEKKLPQLIRASKDKNITNISGVPSWFLTVLKGILKVTGATSIHDVWPNLEVFFHGGISFVPYKSQYAAVCDMTKMHFLDTYNASEGFFAVQTDFATDDMLLLLDTGVFYEFIPLSDPSACPIPIWQVVPGTTYEMIISSCNGLWRYRIGDTITVTSVNPMKIRIAGRTKHFINAFGEELMVYNADMAIVAASNACKVHVFNYTAAPVFSEGNRKGYHQWLIEFDRQLDEGAVERFAEQLDAALRKVNSDYDAKRYHSIFLDRLVIVQAKTGVFDCWLANRTGTIGGQRKIPRLSNEREIIDSLLALNN